MSEAESEAVLSNEADAVEPLNDQEAPRWPEQVPFDADEADAADQTREVVLDEDDYR
ncbi:hypothetical protein [Spirillospora sp. CA-294931]|uniref:hypothetical protein n=1 Tax=Spirillospora sp. CA-294931 TaxID=3240042 RepID=UPI003D89F27B